MLQFPPAPGSRACFPYATLLLASASILVHCAGLGAQLACLPTLQPVWRIATCHFAHWNLDHLFWSGGAFVVLGTLSERSNRRAFLVCVAASAVSIPPLLFLFQPQLLSYAGLSGIDSALFVFIALGMLREARATGDWPWGVASAAVLLLFVAKVALETATGSTIFVEAGAAMIPVPLAHAVGGLAGALVALGAGFTSEHARKISILSSGHANANPLR